MIVRLPPARTRVRFPLRISRKGVNRKVHFAACHKAYGSYFVNLINFRILRFYVWLSLVRELSDMTCPWYGHRGVVHDVVSNWWIDSVRPTRHTYDRQGPDIMHRTSCPISVIGSRRLAGSVTYPLRPRFRDRGDTTAPSCTLHNFDSYTSQDN